MEGIASYLRKFSKLANLNVEFLPHVWLSSQKLSRSNYLANLKGDFLDLKGF